MRTPEQYADDLVVGIHSLLGSKTKLVEIKELATSLFAIAISTAAHEYGPSVGVLSAIDQVRAIAVQEWKHGNISPGDCFDRGFAASEAWNKTFTEEQAKQRASIVEAARAVAQQRDDYRDQMRVLREENYRLKNPTAEKLSPDESWPCWCTHKHFRHDKEPNTRCTECQCNRYDPMAGKA